VTPGWQEWRRQRAPLANTPWVARDATMERRRDFGLGDRKAVDEHKGKHRRA